MLRCEAHAELAVQYGRAEQKQRRRGRDAASSSGTAAAAEAAAGGAVGGDDNAATSAHQAKLAGIHCAKTVAHVRAKDGRPVAKPHVVLGRMFYRLAPARGNAAADHLAAKQAFMRALAALERTGGAGELDGDIDFRKVMQAYQKAEKAHLKATRKDYYEALGLPKTASLKDIKKRYRALALELHPDKQAEGAGAAEREARTKRFQEVAEAYEVLGNAQLRRRYDRGENVMDAPDPQRPPEQGWGRNRGGGGGQRGGWGRGRAWGQQEPEDPFASDDDEDEDAEDGGPKPEEVVWHDDEL